MRWRTTTLPGTALALAVMASGCVERSVAPLADAGAPAAAKVPPPTSFTFVKIPAAQTTQAIASPVTGLDLLVFEGTATQAAGLTIRSLGFMVSGSLQAGDVGNYQLLWYPDGLRKPPVVLGTNTGANWVAPGGDAASFITFDLAQPITIRKDRATPLVFALRADVAGTGTYFFSARAQIMGIDDGTSVRDVTWFGGDLPLQGNTFQVN